MPREKNNTQKTPFLWVEIDLDCLKHNLNSVRALLDDPKAEVMAIVKADAYGHGMKPVASFLRRQGVRFFGVANIDEAVELRGVCPKEKILVLGSFHQSQLPLYFKHKILPTVSSIEDVEAVEKFLKTQKKSFPVHVKIDTGMGRLGVWHDEAESFFNSIASRKKVYVEGVYTHFASADKKDKTATEKQLAFFEAALRKMKRVGISPRYVHAANSLGLLRFKKSHLNVVRPGIVLYGVNPSEHKNNSPLKPILSLKTRIAFLKKVHRGCSVSYGGTHVVPKDTWVATLPVGYSHGFRVGFSNKAHVAIRGRRCPVIGRVTMDQTLVDVGSVPGVRRWDEVTLIGKDGAIEISAAQMAHLLGTIPYEIFCSLSGRIPRIYKG